MPIVTSQLKELKEIKELKPLKLPGEKDPTQAISTCPYCNSAVNQNTTICQNCKKVITPNQGQPYPRKVPQKGERYDEFGLKDQFVAPSSFVGASSKFARKKKDEDMAEDNKNKVKDEFVSEEIKMCLDPQRKIKKNVDKKEDIMRSCLDLEIDG